MDDKRLQDRIEAVLETLSAQQLEQRIAPAKCEKNPDDPQCGAVALYGVECPDNNCGLPD